MQPEPCFCRSYGLTSLYVSHISTCHCVHWARTVMEEQGRVSRKRTKLQEVWRQNETDEGKERRGLMAVIKVIMFQSERCAAMDHNINGGTIKMQITGWGGFGKWGVLPSCHNKFYVQPHCSVLCPCKPSKHLRADYRVCPWRALRQPVH